MFRKIVDTTRLPHGEVTLTRRTTQKLDIEANRIVTVSDTVLETSGSVSTRLRERGWRVMRRPHIVPACHSGGPLTTVLPCMWITPELSNTYTEEDFAAGTLTNAVVTSYLRHMKTMHHLRKHMFVVGFGKISINKSFRRRRNKKFQNDADSTQTPTMAMRSSPAAL